MQNIYYLYESPKVTSSAICFPPCKFRPQKNNNFLCIKFNKFAFFLKISFLKNMAILVRTKTHSEQNFGFSLTLVWQVWGTASRISWTV